MVEPLAGYVVAVGDFNERPGGPVRWLMAAAGLRDGWQAAVRGRDGRTSRPPTLPDQLAGVAARHHRGAGPAARLRVRVACGQVGRGGPHPGEDGLVRFSAISDHLPLTAILELGSEATAAVGRGRRLARRARRRGARPAARPRARRARRSPRRGTGAGRAGGSARPRCRAGRTPHDQPARHVGEPVDPEVDAASGEEAEEAKDTATR